MPRIALATDLFITKFSGATISAYDRGMHNAMARPIGDRLIVTQRPPIDIFDDASAEGADARGRGVYYRAHNSKLYFVNNDTLFDQDYGSANPVNISAGTGRVYIAELDEEMIITDPANGEAWYLDTGDNLAQITDVDFPTEQTPAIGLAHGVVSMDGYIFVLGTNGSIYNCDFEDMTAWTGTNFLTAERDPDGGAYLGKHHDHLVALGPRTIEFFYNNANPTGSPLNRREDVFYELGCSDGGSVWEEGDRLFFIGVEPSGAIGVYALQGFEHKKLSTDTIDAFLYNAVVQDVYTVRGSGFTAQGHTFYIITLFTEPSDLSPEISLVYDITSGLWGTWETTVGGLTKFPVIGFTFRTSIASRNGEGIMANGDLFTVRGSFTSQDSRLADQYVADGYVAGGFVQEVAESGTNMTTKIRTGQQDFGTKRRKFAGPLQLIGDRSDEVQAVTLRWADENSLSFNTGRTMDMSIDHIETGMGAFTRRNYELEFTTSELLRLEAIGQDIRTGV